MRLLVWAPLTLALSLVSACEPKIEEPAPHPRASASRCIKTTPPEPARPAPAGPTPDPACPEDPETPPKLATGHVIFTEAGQKDITVEITDNDETRQRGLMYRKSLDEDKGMIFSFAVKDDHTFWMKNTCLPLDMMFIDDDGVIVGIEENVPTMNEHTYSVGCRSKYVLEVNAGFSRRHGVVAGQHVRLQGI